MGSGACRLGRMRAPGRHRGRATTLPDSITTAPPLLAARGLSFARNEQPVFGPLDFAVDAGEALLVQGDNGAGKTTLLRVLAGLLRADAGDIEHRRARRRQHHCARVPSPTSATCPALKADLSTLGEPGLPVRPAWSPARPDAGQRAGDRRPGRLRGHARPPAVRGPEEAPVAGAPVAVAGAAVAAGRALRQPRPGRHQPGQSHGPGAPARRRRGAADHPRRLRRAAGADADARRCERPA